MSTLSRERLNAGITAVHKEAAGVVQIALLAPEDKPALIGGVLAGEPDALFMVQMAADHLRAIAAHRNTRTPLLCTSCPAPLEPENYTLAVILPAKSDPAGGIALGVCPSCATTRDAVKARAIAAVKRLWPDSRPLNIHPGEGGRA